MSTGVQWFLVMNVAAGLRSIAMAFLPSNKEASAVPPEPQNGSSTISPGFV